MTLRCPQSPAILAILALGATLVCAACGSSSAGQQAARAGDATQISALSVSGAASFADGTPVSSRSMQLQLILDGANLFQAGVNGCLPTPAHVAGTVIQSSGTDAQGQYALTVPVTSLRAAVVRQCSIQSLSAAQVEGISLRASILADSTTCPAYCSAQGDPSASCVNDCTSGNRTIDASQAVSPDQLQALLKSGGTIQWTQPLAFNGLGPALGSGSAPDLVVDGAAAQASAHVDQESFSATSCEVAEQCVRAPGLRTVLRFDGTIENLGDADLVIGSPTQSGLFTQSTCHNVPLLKNIMLYELIDPQTGEVVQADGTDVVGRKQGFCMMDITQINATAPQGRYDCNNQGITRGWADVYDADLECQLLDVTGVTPGDYQLRLTANPDGLFDESDPSNNTVSVPVSIPASVPQGAATPTGAR
jgi:hypothetical protein